MRWYEEWVPKRSYFYTFKTLLRSFRCLVSVWPCFRHDFHTTPAMFQNIKYYLNMAFVFLLGFLNQLCPSYGNAYTNTNQHFPTIVWTQLAIYSRTKRRAQNDIGVCAQSNRITIFFRDYQNSYIYAHVLCTLSHVTSSKLNCFSIQVSTDECIYV